MHRGHGEGVEAEQASQAACPVQQAAWDNELEVENGGLPNMIAAASETGEMHEVQRVVTKTEVKGQ